MTERRRLLIVIADGEHARFFRPDPDCTLHRQLAFDSIAAHKRSSELGTDEPGAAFHSNASAHHARLPRHDRHSTEKKRFAQEVARQIDIMTATDAFDALVLAAPSHTLNAFRQEISDVTATKIAAILAKDLVKTPDHELWPHIRACLHPASAAKLTGGEFHRSEGRT